LAGWKTLGQRIGRFEQNLRMAFAIIAGNADPSERLHVRQRLPLWAEIAGSVEKHRRGAVTGQPGVDRLAPGRIDVEGIRNTYSL
jgi:hypothetical protein